MEKESAFSKQEKEIDAKIFAIINKINSKYSELLKYINEIPTFERNIDTPDIALIQLNEYYESLCSILMKYGAEHGKSL
ncbi:MAG: hypothetical protein K9G40_06315 [Crocinitomicaceae bacterium]|nr:hypothetical protein [Crocinitomicaceae bacterium]